jgi:hypothetical protein
MVNSVTPLVTRGFGRTSRRDRWWVQPAAVFAGLGAFVVYSTWATFQGNHYHRPRPTTVFPSTL